jgi:hypothetical protein
LSPIATVSDRSNSDDAIGMMRRNVVVGVPIHEDVDGNLCRKMKIGEGNHLMRREVKGGYGTGWSGWAMLRWFP